ncbi:AAA family ATPase [Paraburkholderia sediminicola]|uniref:AAA family ATPase n=1 Tax=Paraburkholderia sediminicola TaxID=458836 RepID=UPI0038BC58DD
MNAPIKVRLQYFKNAILGHDIFDDVLEKIEAAIECGLPGTMLVLVGPAGVGKSSVGDVLHKRVSEDFFEANPDDKHTIPSVLLEAWSGEEGRFDFKEFYEQILEALQAPLISNTLPEVKRVICGREFFLPDITNRRAPTVSAYRARLRRSISERKPRFLFFDEASAIIASSKPDRVRSKSNTLRSMVNSSNTTMILSGAYDLYDLVLQTGQLARRGDVIHMPAYLPSQKRKFAKVLYALQDLMPMKGGCDLTPFADDLSNQSLFTTGLLKKILTNAIALSDKLKRPIDEEILSLSYYKPAQLEKLQLEMFDGYYKVEGVQHPNDKRELMPVTTGEGSAEVSTTTTAKKRGRVGKTIPTRGAVEHGHA